MHRYEQRRERLRALMREQGLAALLVTHAANRFYLSGFELHDPQCNESAGRLLILPDGKDWLCTDARYLTAAQRLWDPSRVFIYGADCAAQLAKLIADQVAPTTGSIGFEAKIMTLDFYDELRNALPDTHSLARADGLVEQLRRIKDEDEIARMRRACALNHELMAWLPPQLVAERSEADLAWRIERFFRERGASELAFASIVGRGPNGALPHYIPSTSEPLHTEDSVLVDVGCRLDDYCSDQTRTFWVGGKPSDVFLRTLDAVQEAQKRAIAVIRPGVRACDVFQQAMSYFESLGLDKAFTHSLGHGIGLETHEGPSLNSRNTAPLEAGMVVTVEPGLYYPEWGGVRWEYMVVVTPDGAQIL